MLEITFNAVAKLRRINYFVNSMNKKAGKKEKAKKVKRDKQNLSVMLVNF